MVAGALIGAGRFWRRNHERRRSDKLAIFDGCTDFDDLGLLNLIGRKLCRRLDSDRKLGISRAMRQGISEESPFADFREYVELVLGTLAERECAPVSPKENQQAFLLIRMKNLS